MLIVPPTSRRCTLNRTYMERNSAVWCGTVQCTFSCSLLCPPIPCFIMTNEVIIRCQKTPEVGIRRIPAYGLHTPNKLLEPVKNLGGLGKIWGGGCAPWPQPKTATGYDYRCVLKFICLFLLPQITTVWKSSFFILHSQNALFKFREPDPVTGPHITLILTGPQIT